MSVYFNILQWLKIDFIVSRVSKNLHHEMSYYRTDLSSLYVTNACYYHINYQRFLPDADVYQLCVLTVVWIFINARILDIYKFVKLILC